MEEMQYPRCVDFFSEIVTVMKGSKQHERAFHLIIDRITRLFRCQTCAILLIDPKTEYLVIENGSGVSWTYAKAFRRKVATGAVGELIWTGKPIILHNAGMQPCLADEVQLEHAFASCYCFRIATAQHTCGYLHVDCKEQCILCEKDLQMLQTFADLAAVALYKDLLYEENLHLDRIDHETGLEKYPPFLERMKTNLERVKETTEPFSVLILDVDNYKEIVNTYGYDSSRKFLHELGQLVRTHIRPIDAAGRHGPDEIIIMLVNTDMPGALIQAKALRGAVEETRFTDHQLCTTISLGVSSYPVNGHAPEALVSSARTAVFEAQRTGRNKVFHFQGDWSAHEHVLCEAE